MTTYEKWMQKFNAGGHESFEEFICNQFDELTQGIAQLLDFDDAGIPGNGEMMREEAAERVTPVEVPEPRIQTTDEDDAPGGSSDT